LSYPISFPWNSIFGWRPLIRTRYTMWQSLVTKNRKSKKLFIKIWFFLHFFLTILPVRAFVRPRQKVSRGHFVSILCSTAFCALNHGLNFVGNSAYTFQRERLTHNLQNIFSFWQKSCKKIIFELIFTSRIAWVLTYLIKSVWFTYWKSVPFFCKTCIIRRKRILFLFLLTFFTAIFSQI
jgi:hypothetical protein